MDKKKADTVSNADQAHTNNSNKNNSILENEICSGFGKFHSEDNDHAPKKYVSITLSEVAQQLEDPRQTDKSQAQWAIFSSLKSRNHAEQRKRGQFYALWADIDETHGLSFIEAYQKAEKIVQANFMAYTSSSATEDNQKARLIIPLSEPVSGDDFLLLQTVLNRKLEAEGVTPDRATLRAGQLCYLPNEGDFYSFEHEESRSLFAPSSWADDVEQLKTEQREEAERIKRNREQSRLRAAERLARGNTSPIDAFNAEYDLETMFNTFGYMRKGNRWLSPNSESNQAGVIVSDDRRKWISTHESDAHMGHPANGCTIGDPFDLFSWFQHNGDRTAALRDVAEMFKLNSANKPSEQSRQGDDENKKPFSLKDFALNGQSKEMRQQMLEDKFVLGRLAIYGQWTVFYAPPNAGKTLITLRLLIDAIQSGDIDGANVFYINADDNFKGLTTKLELAEQNGFMMVAPGFEQFSVSDFNSYLATMIEEDSAKGVVIILDTLKKFTDIMDKRLSSEFGRHLRGFVSRGGTVVALAHTNKNRDTDGKLVFSGTSDIVDDADCVYLLDATEHTHTHKTVVFENKKSRGDVEQEAAYRYLAKVSGSDYKKLLNSVEQVGEAEAAQARELQQMETKLAKNRDIIQEIQETIEQGIHNKTEIVKAVHEVSGASKSAIRKVLTDHTGRDYMSGHRWRVSKGEKNAKLFYLLMNGRTTGNQSERYQEATQGF